MTPPDRSRSLLLIVLAGAAVYALSMGVRQAMPLFIGEINTHTGLGLGTVSLAFGIGQLMWGITQPIGGALADRFGNAGVFIGGALMMAAGTALIPWSSSFWALALTVGLLGAGGSGFAGTAVTMAAISRMVPAQRRGWANGVVNAGGSFGQFVLLPLAAWMLLQYGWNNALPIVGLIALLVIPASWRLWLGPSVSVARQGPASSANAAADTPGTHDQPILAVIGQALRDRSFLLLCAGFFVCGFHVAFIATHLPGVIALCGLPSVMAGWSLGVIGLFNIFGSLWAGSAIGRWRSKSLLSAIYAARGLIVLAFLFAPKTEFTFLVFSAAIGFTYLSTVPPTADLVAKLYGPRYMATLFGLVVLTHQIGGFLGAWLGGQAFELTGNYDWMWYVDILLAAGAALVHLPIREQAVSRTATA